VSAKNRDSWPVDEKHQIISVELTTQEVGDPSAVPDLLGQIDSDFELFIADGAI
jgi:hypothetical protein